MCTTAVLFSSLNFFTLQQSPSQNTALTKVPVYIINLTAEKERYVRAQKLFSKLSRHVFRIEGVNSTIEHRHYLHSSLHEISNLCYRSETDKVFDKEYWGVLGCTLSHLKAISFLHEAQTNVAIIVEDDAVTDLSPLWVTGIDKFMRQLPHNWTIVQLSLTGTEDMWSRAFLDWQRQCRVVSENTEFWGTVAYLINRNGIQHVVNAYGVGKFNLTGLGCINADVDLLKSAVPAGSYFIATPPLLTFTDDAKSNVHGTNLHTLIGQNPSSHRAQVHALSRQYALEWNALNWRESALQ